MTELKACPTAHFGCSPDENQSYVRIHVEPKDGQLTTYRLSVGGAEVLAAEINGALSRTPSISGQDDLPAFVEHLRTRAKAADDIADATDFAEAADRLSRVSGQEVVTEATDAMIEAGVKAWYDTDHEGSTVGQSVADIYRAMVSAVSLPQQGGVPASPSGQSVSDPSPDGLGHTATVPNADVLADMGRAAENELMSELGHYDAGLAAWKVLAVAGVAAIPDDEIDTSDIPEVTDWSGAVRGRFTASGTEARRAETGNTDSVHDDPVGNAETPKASQE